MTDVYINDASAFLPNAPVSNDDIDRVLGELPNVGAKTRRIVLKNNQIRNRHYAVDPETGALTHSNAELAAEAVRKLRPFEEFQMQDVECLCCGTSTPDILLPGHGLMVLGELGIPECDAMSAAGICISGMTALKYGFMNVATGAVDNAVAVGSELASSLTRSRFMVPLMDAAGVDALEKRPINAFDADFLRWMLSDGAGAVYLSPDHRPGRMALRIDWIEHISLAGQMETCMYAGGVKGADGRVTGWRDTERIPAEAVPHLMSIRQDIKLLDREIVASMGRVLQRVIDKRGLRPGEIDWFLPHYSSAYFRPKFFEEMARIGFEIPYDKWFTNLSEKGNTGSAAIYIILEEIFHSGQLTPGQRLLCFIPESGRFAHCFMHLTAVT